MIQTTIANSVNLMTVICANIFDINFLSSLFSEINFIIEYFE